MEHVTISATIGANLRRRRQAAGLSLADLASAAGLGKTTLHALELGEGNPTLSTLWALATALGVPLGDLLDDRPAPVAVVRADQGARIDGAAVHARLLHRLACAAGWRSTIWPWTAPAGFGRASARRPGVHGGDRRAGPLAGRADDGRRPGRREIRCTTTPRCPHLYQGLAGPEPGPAADAASLGAIGGEA